MRAWAKPQKLAAKAADRMRRPKACDVHVLDHPNFETDLSGCMKNQVPDWSGRHVVVVQQRQP